MGKYMAHIHDKIDVTAEALVVFRRKVLLRKHDKYKLWLTVDGHIELDEDPNQAILREVKEEVGLDIELVDIRLYYEESTDYRELVPPRFLNRHRINSTHEHVTLTFLARAQTDRFRNDSDEASDEIRWFTREDLADPQFDLIDRVRAYAQIALDEVG